MGIFGAQGAQAQQEAAGPKAQEPLGRMGALYAATPERNGGEVKVLGFEDGVSTTAMISSILDRES